MAIAINHHHGFKPFSRSPRCRLHSFTQLDFNLLELDQALDQAKLACSLKQSLAPTNFHKSFSTPCLPLTPKVEEDADNGPRVEIVAGRGAPGVRALVVESAIAMASGVDPVPVTGGLGGAYFLRNRNGDNIAVAKPIDEEPFAVNNPKGFAGRILGQPGLKRSVRVGETGIREVAAYLLDHGGFAGVPPTTLVKISHVTFHVNRSTAAETVELPKVASLQRFIDHDLDAGELGPSGFSVSSIHRIGILDVRLLNLDRHAGNILVKKYGGYVNDSYSVGATELVPIDHGLCLPEMLDDPYFEWLHWPQAAVPFSELEAEYISQLDPFKDAELLRKELPSLRESSIRVLILCTIFLKRAASAGLCLADIGDMMTREFCGGEEGPSVLETLCAKAKANMHYLFEIEPVTEDKEEQIGMFQLDIDCEENTADVLDLPRLLQSCPGMGKPPRPPKKFRSARSVGRQLSHMVLSPLHEEDDDNGSTSGEENNVNNGVIESNENNDDGDDNDNDDDDNVDDDNDNEDDDDDDDDDDGNDDDNDDGDKVVGLTKSVSFSVPQHNNEPAGFSFRGMTEEEWELFLDKFGKLLPEAFEGRKNMGLKKRLGTSCQF
ncbi:PREDICTED: phosphatidylinositol 4-kinase gamma 8 [Nelumbo nucifera]|uniref:1-phosphatidylinositol 4-kinase n=1 Tax=Nelumbo nucifera TaxID=4432 RepID=A0A1U7ZG54_NELNU|nr:PREDICTED: phosphatidylinositol 4-kinase gamma 8 [Nelumbo nucifera]